MRHRTGGAISGSKLGLWYFPRMPDLPYFDLLIDERRDGGETGQMFEHQVHWGYWEAPRLLKAPEPTTSRPWSR